MNPDDFFATVTERQLAQSSALTHLWGAHVTPLTLEEAQAIIAYERTSKSPTGFCHDCGKEVEPRRMWCDEHLAERHRAQARELARFKRASKPPSTLHKTCMTCGAKSPHRYPVDDRKEWCCSDSCAAVYAATVERRMKAKR